MTVENKKILFHLILTVTTVILTFSLIIFIWNQAQITSESNIKEKMLFFPFSLLMFSLFTVYAVKTRTDVSRFLFQDSLFSIAVIPYLLVLVSWRIWSDWITVIAFFYGLWILIRTNYCLRLIQKKNVSENRSSSYALFFILIVHFESLLRRFDGSLGSILQIIISTLANFIFIIIVRELSAKYEFKFLKTQSSMPDFIALSAIFSIPFFQNIANLEWTKMLAISVGFLLLVIDYPLKSYQKFGYAAGVPAIVAPAMYGFSYLGVSLWVGFLIIRRTIQERSERKFLEIAASVTLMIVAVFSAILIRRGSVYSTDYVWPIHAMPLVLASFFDIQKGVLFAIPLSAFALIGYFLSIRKGADWLNLLGPAMAFLPIVTVQNLQSGNSPEIHELIPFLMLLSPYAVRLLPALQRPVAKAVIQGFAYLTIALFLAVFPYLMKNSETEVGFFYLLDSLAKNTDIDYLMLFPYINQLSQYWTMSITIWVSAYVILFLIVFYEMQSKRKIGYTASDTFLLVVFLILASTLWFSTQKLQNWKQIPFETEIILDEQRPSYEFEMPEEVLTGCELISSLGNAADVKQNEAVCTIRFMYGDQEVESCAILAGVHSAEAAYMRADVIKNVKHDMPTTISRNKAILEDGSPYEVFGYRGKWLFERPQKVARITVKMEEKYVSSRLRISISRLSLRLTGNYENWGKPYILTIPAQLTLSCEQPSFTVELKEAPRFNRVQIVSSLSNAAELADGMMVGRMELLDRYGLTTSIAVRSGVDVSEWSADRLDLLGRIRHKKAEIALSKKQADADGNIFLAHKYLANKRLHPSLEPIKINLQYDLSEDVCRHCGWTISSISLH